MKKYLDKSQKNAWGSIVPLNKSTKIETACLPNYYEWEEVTIDV